MLNFLFKGLIRDRSRSLFPVLMVSAGVFLSVFLYSWIQGVTSGMVETNARFDTGYVKVTTRAYNDRKDQMPNDCALLGVNALLHTLHTTNPNMLWTPRIRFNGLLDIPDAHGETSAQGPIIGMGIDLLEKNSCEYRILNLSKALVQGRLPHNPRELLISDSLARKLHVHCGDTATLIGATMFGSMTTYNFIVVGTIRFEMSVLDNNMVIADIRDIQDALDMQDGASEIVGYTHDMVYADPAMAQCEQQFNQHYATSKDQFAPIMTRLSDQNGLGDMLAVVKRVISVIALLFVFVMSIVLWNAGLMGNIRRYGEIGLRLAIGEPKPAVYRRMLYESALIGIMGSAIGTTLGLCVAYYLQYHGIDISAFLTKSEMLVAYEMRAQVTPTSYYIGFLPGLIAPLIGTMAAGIGIYHRQTAQLFKELET